MWDLPWLGPLEFLSLSGLSTWSIRQFVNDSPQFLPQHWFLWVFYSGGSDDLYSLVSLSNLGGSNLPCDPTSFRIQEELIFQLVQLLVKTEWWLWSSYMRNQTWGHSSPHWPTHCHPVPRRPLSPVKQKSSHSPLPTPFKTLGVGSFPTCLPMHVLCHVAPKWLSM